MANIILKDKNGKDAIFEGVDSVSFRTVEGKTVKFSQGGGAGFVDATELPDTADEGATYKVTADVARPYLHFPSENISMTLEELYSLELGLDVNINGILVDELPDTLTPADLATFTFYLYVPRETYTKDDKIFTAGVGYLTMDGVEIISIGQMMEGMPEHGFTDDISLETEAGIYTVVREETHYYVYFENNWVEVTAPVENLKFELSEDGTYYIVSANHSKLSGFVAIPSEHEGLPVKEVKEAGFVSCFSILFMDIPESVTTIGASAFDGCIALNELTIENDAVQIGEGAFSNCRYLEDSLLHPVFKNLLRIEPYTFDNCTHFYYIPLGEKLTFIGTYAFSGCSDAIHTKTWNGDTESYSGTGELIIPASVQEIADRAFNGCYGFNKIIFKGTPITISQWALSGNHNIKDVYVPWAEGAVANAPWGAPTTATIHYNSDTANM